MIKTTTFSILLLSLLFLAGINTLHSLAITGNIRPESSGLRKEQFFKAYVRVKELRKNYEINNEGQFMITGLSSGTYSLEFLVPGYKKEVKAILLKKDLHMDVVLKLQEIDLHPVIVNITLTPEQKAFLVNRERIIGGEVLNDIQQKTGENQNVTPGLNPEGAMKVEIDIGKTVKNIMEMIKE